MAYACVLLAKSLLQILQNQKRKIMKSLIQLIPKGEKASESTMTLGKA